MDIEEKLVALEEKVANDASLPLQESNLVFGDGDPRSPVVFIGEAPGFHENEKRKPFVGRAGQLLNRVLWEEAKMRREDVYITNIVKRRPSDNRDPLPDEIAAYAPYLAKQLAIMQPHIIVTLGRFAMNYFLPDAKISKAHGTAFRAKGRLIYPVYHPAAALRSPDMHKAFRADIRKLPSLLKKAGILLFASENTAKKED